MAISLLSNLMINMKQPTTVRDQFSTLEDMKSFREEYLPDMYDSFCLETGLKYRFNRSNPIDEITGKWRVIGEGGSSDLSLYYTKTETNNLLDNKVDKVSGKDLSTNDFTDAYKQQIDDNKTAIETLNGNSTVVGSVDSKVSTAYSNATSYTDTECAKKVDVEQGSVNEGKILQVNSSGNLGLVDPQSTIDLSDYVSKTNDVVNTYSGQEVDKTKIPNLGAMDELKTLVDTDLNGKVSTAQGVANEGKILQVNGEGNLALVDVGSVVGTDASDVSYTNASYPLQDTVEKALNAIWNRLDYVPITINSLSVNPSTLIYEVGTAIRSLVFNWSLNKTPTNQTFNGTTVANDTNTFTYDTPFSTNKTFTLNVSDSIEYT